MNNPPVNTLLTFANEQAVQIVHAENHVEAKVVRDEATIVVTVPREVLEWSVKAVEVPRGRVATDWFDYVGYDDRPEAELAAEMARHVGEYVRHLIDRPLRWTTRRALLGKKDHLEWTEDGEWRSAVPME